MPPMVMDAPGVDSPLIDAVTGTRFATAIDETAMRAVFARHVPAAAGMVVACAVTRYRHRPHDRCLVQYALTVREPGGGDTTLRVTGQWHAEAGRAAHLARKLAKAARNALTTWTSPLAPVVFDAATGMLATTFPWDRRLPALPDIASGRSPRLLAAMCAWLDVPPPPAGTAAVEIVRYREQLNAVCRYTLATRDGGAARFYVKAYADDSGAAAAALLDHLAAATARTGTARVQPAVAYDDSLRALVLADTPGEPLDQILRGSAGATAAALTRVAAALARFGAATAPLDRVVGPAQRLAAADRSTAALAEALPAASGRAAQDTRRAAGAMLQPGPHGLTHGDLKLEHIFVAGPDVFLIDVDSSHLGDPLWDLALLEARWLAARDAAPGGRRQGLQECRHLAGTYLSHCAARDATRLGALRALALLDVAAGLVKRREPAWTERASRLVADAGTALEVRHA